MSSIILVMIKHYQNRPVDLNICHKQADTLIAKVTP